jgi:transposase
MSKRRTFSDRFKENAVKQVLEQGKISASVAKELDISPNTLHNWKMLYLKNNDAIENPSSSYKNSSQYIKDLERKVKRLEDERELLKKATIFFANQPE